MKRFMVVLESIILSLCIPICVFAEEEYEAEETTMSPIIALPLAILWVILTYKIYKKLYSDTVLFGTRQGIANERGRMIGTAFFISMMIVGAIYLLLKAVFKIAIIVLIIVGIFIAIKKIKGKQSDDKDT